MKNIKEHNILSSYFRLQFPIKEANFYHYISQAWIIAILLALRQKYLAQIEEGLNNNKKNSDIFNKDFNEILVDIKDLQINYKFFIDCLEVLLGTYKINDQVFKITQMKLSQLYLKKIEIARDEILSREFNSILSKNEFEKILNMIMLTGLNYTLNELDCRISDKNSKLLLTVFEELKNNKNISFDMNLFIIAINKRMDFIQNNYEVEILNSEITFYNFAKYNFDDFLENIRIFNLNANSICYIILEKVKDSIINYNSSFKGIFQSFINHSEIKLVTDYLYNVYRFICGGNIRNLLKYENISNAYTNNQKWIKNIPFNIYFTVINNLTYTYHYISKDIIKYNTDKTITLIFDISKWSIYKAFFFKNFIIESFNKNLNTIKDCLFDNTLFRMSYDNEKYLQLDISKKIGQEKLCEISNQIINKFIDMTLVFKNNVFQSKDLIIKKFKNILGINESINTPGDIYVEMTKKIN